jgi:ankyrin repeat protein
VFLRGTKRSPNPHLQKYPFLKYAIFYWGRHVTQQSKDFTALAVQLLTDDDNLHCISRNLLVLAVAVANDPIEMTNSEAKPPLDSQFALHIAAVFGLGEVAKSILAQYENFDINKTLHTQTPLYVAASAGNESFVQSLIEMPNVNVNAVDEFRETALFSAIFFNYESVVPLLLQRDDVDVEFQNYWGRTALSVTAE